MAVSSPKFDPMERPDTLTDQAYSQIKRALMSGAFAPGQKITIRKMADALGMSLTPAREALGRLVAERALEFGPNRSVFVPNLDRDKIEELYKIRIALEGMAAEAAMKAIDDDQVEELAQCQLRLVAAMDRQDFKTVMIQNEEFHFTIYRAAGMPMLAQIIESLWLQIGPLLNLLYPDYSRGRKGVQHHMEAIKALKARDAKGLRDAIIADLQDGSRHLLQEFEKLQTAAAQ